MQSVTQAFFQSVLSALVVGTILGVLKMYQEVALLKQRMGDQGLTLERETIRNDAQDRQQQQTELLLARIDEKVSQLLDMKQEDRKNERGRLSQSRDQG